VSADGTDAVDRAFERRLWWLVGVLCVAAGVAHAGADVDVARAAKEHDLARNLVLQWTTEFGEAIWWLVPAGVVFAVAAKQQRHNLARWAFAVIAAVGASGIIVNGLKIVIGKSRPKLLFSDGRLDFTPFSYGHEVNSFPSGHATTLAAAAVVLSIAFPRARVAILPAAFLLALTRVAIHAHYLSDVCAGFALGLACGLLTFRVWRAKWPASVPQA
jgi:undecaprenyl-diphosphatase